jgi:trans-aconitate methyltransferase
MVASDLVELDIYGCDCSASLIEEARRAVLTGNFQLGDLDASFVPNLNRFPSKASFAADVTVFHSVLQYLSQTDAAGAILQATDSSRSKGLVAEVLDSELDHESELHRSAVHGAENYKEEYHGLGHTSFNQVDTSGHACRVCL